MMKGQFTTMKTSKEWIAEVREKKAEYAKMRATALQIVNADDSTAAEKLEASRLILDIDERVKTIYDKR
jgi:hypothetical protein